MPEQTIADVVQLEHDGPQSLLDWLGIGYGGTVNADNKEWLKHVVCEAIDHAAVEERPYELKAGSMRRGQGTLRLYIKAPAKHPHFGEGI